MIINKFISIKAGKSNQIDTELIKDSITYEVSKEKYRKPQI